MRSADWDERYAAAPLLWGARPNRFVESRCGDLPPGRALDLACGEGRNATWLASRGWTVVGVDFSPVAIERGREAARHAGVVVDLRVGDVLTADLGETPYDLVLLSYLQLPPDGRRVVLARAAAAVAAGGRLLLVAHDLRNLTEGHGGPKDADVLWTADEVIAGLDGFTILEADTVLREVEDAPRPAIDTLVVALRSTARA